jgi:hypothetical protein
MHMLTSCVVQRHAAALCYICCADVDAAVTLWLSEATDASLPVPRLQSVLEKSISLCLAAAHQAATASLADLLANYALRLVDQGAMRSAITYLSLLDQLPVDSAPSLAVLKDRVSQCSPHEVRSTFASTSDNGRNLQLAVQLTDTRPAV